MPYLNSDVQRLLEDRFERSKKKQKISLNDDLGSVDYLKVNSHHCYKYVYNKATGDFVFTAYEKRQPKIKHVLSWIKRELVLIGLN